MIFQRRSLQCCLMTFLIVSCVICSAMIEGVTRTGFFWRGTNLFLKSPETYNAPLVSFQDTSSENIKGEETLAVLPEGNPAFLGSRKLLFINELRFRKLLNDVYHGNQYLVRSFVNTDGSIEPVQLKCKIVECKRLSTGQAMYVIEGQERVELQCVRLSEEGYLLAEANALPETSVNAKPEKMTALASDVFSQLKAYLRLVRALPSMQQSEGSESANRIYLSPMVMKSHDTGDHDAFSHAVSNLISTAPTVMHGLFAGSAEERLDGLSKILSGALEALREDLSSQGTMNAIEVDRIIDQSSLSQDSVDDLRPPADVKELSLEGVEGQFGEDVMVEESKSSANADVKEKASSSQDEDLWGANAFQ